MTPNYYVSRNWLALWTLLVIVFVIAPFFFIGLVSLTTKDFISLPTEGITFKWYAAIADKADFLTATFHSLLLAFIASVVSMVFGTLAALAIVRHRFPFRSAIRMFLISPLFVPMVMTGLAILVFFSTLGFGNQFLRLAAGHCILTLPYVVRTVSASLTGFDPNQEFAARNLGANPLQAFILVTLPQIGPGIVAAGVFSFIVSFDNVGLSIFLASPSYSTLPVTLFLYASYESDPVVAAISVLVVVCSLGIVALLERTIGLQRLMG